MCTRKQSTFEAAQELGAAIEKVKEAMYTAFIEPILQFLSRFIK